MYNDQDRAFHYAVVFSIALHGALLAALSTLPEPRTRAPAPGPIIARLVQPAPPATPTAAPRPERVEPTMEEKKPAPSLKPVPAAKPRPLSKAEPKSPAKAAPTTPSAPAPESMAEASPSPPATSAAPAPAAPSEGAVARAEPVPAPAAPSADTFDAGSLAQYRLQLISAARKYKRYPRAAMDNNWEGDVVVRMVIGANGMISALSVKSSSGHEVLDRQALEMFRQATRAVTVPPALRGKEFAIELRAIYSLKDEESS